MFETYQRKQLLVTLSTVPVLVLLVALLIQIQPEQQEPAVAPASAIQMPDFTSFADVKEKKRAFFNYLLPKVRQANGEVAIERRQLLELIEKSAHQSLSEEETASLNGLMKRYKLPVKTEYHSADLARLLKRVDVVPASLILAQAANESAWGTSRFARNGNNFFGIWCFRAGCGAIPNDRDEGKRHEVARFESVLAGVRYYIHNINTHAAYADLRTYRSQLYINQAEAPGIKLAEGLLRYSERGHEYVKEIQAMIRVNNLQRYTLPFPHPQA